MKLLRELFISFVKIGLFTFGGGYAMLPMLQREVVDRHHWATEREMLDYFAVGQCTPGVIAVNTATFVGVKLKGALGGAVATFAVVLPSFLIITVISTLLKQFSSYEIVRHAFAGIRIGVAALVVVSVARLFQKGVKDLLGIVIFACALLLVGFFDCSPIWVVLASVVIGIVKAGRKGREVR